MTAEVLEPRFLSAPACQKTGSRGRGAAEPLRASGVKEGASLRTAAM